MDVLGPGGPTANRISTWTKYCQYFSGVRDWCIRLYKHLPASRQLSLPFPSRTSPVATRSQVHSISLVPRMACKYANKGEITACKLQQLYRSDPFNSKMLAIIDLPHLNIISSYCLNTPGPCLITIFNFFCFAWPWTRFRSPCRKISRKQKNKHEETKRMGKQISFRLFFHKAFPTNSESPEGRCTVTTATPPSCSDFSSAAATQRCPKLSPWKRQQPCDHFFNSNASTPCLQVNASWFIHDLHFSCLLHWNVSKKNSFALWKTQAEEQ